MKKSISELLEERKAEVKFRTDRTQAELLDVFEYRIAGRAAVVGVAGGV